MTNTVWGWSSPAFWSSGSSPVRFCSPVGMCSGLTADISPEAGCWLPRSVSEAVRIPGAAAGKQARHRGAMAPLLAGWKTAAGPERLERRSKVETRLRLLREAPSRMKPRLTDRQEGRQTGTESIDAHHTETTPGFR